MTARWERIKCADLRTARNRAPWAVRFGRIPGGWLAFASVEDYQTWRDTL